MCGTLHFLLLESSLVGHPKIKGSSRNTQTPYQGALMLRRGHSGRAVSFGASSSEACMISDSDSSGLIQTVMSWVTIWELLQVVNKTYWSGWEPIWSRLNQWEPSNITWLFRSSSSLARKIDSSAHGFLQGVDREPLKFSLNHKSFEWQFFSSACHMSIGARASSSSDGPSSNSLGSTLYVKSTCLILLGASHDGVAGSK